MIRSLSKAVSPYVCLLCSFLVIGLVPQLNASELIKGDVTDKEKTDASFTFPLQNYLFNPSSGAFYAVAHQQGYGKNKLTVAQRGSKVFMPVSTRHVLLDGKPDKSPLHWIKTQVDHVGLLGDQLIMVDRRLPDVLFLQQNTNSWLSTSGQAIHDAHGRPGRITGLASNNQEYIFATVAPQEKSFGVPGSGIVLVRKSERKKMIESKSENDDEDDKEKNASKEITIHGLRVQTAIVRESKTKRGNKKQKQTRKKRTKRSLTIPFDGSHAALKIGTDLGQIGEVVALHWDSQLQCLYIGLHVKAGDNAGDGARAVAVGRLVPADMQMLTIDEFILPDKRLVRGNSQKHEQRKRKLEMIQHKLKYSHVDERGNKKRVCLVIDPIATEDVFEDTTGIIGTRGAGTQVSVHQIGTMHTSTLLSYLIVAGGNGAPEATGNCVYAVPLVDERKEFTSITDGILGAASQKVACIVSRDHGTLGSYIGKPKDYINDGSRRFESRAFIAPAHEGNAPSSNDKAVMVGAGPLPLPCGHVVSKLQVAGDAVFAAVATSYEQGGMPGIYHSQAIFDEFGRVAAWTRWQRVAGTDDPIHGMAYDEQTGSFWYLTGTQQATIKRTSWSNGEGNGLLGGEKSTCNETTRSSKPAEKNGLLALLNHEFPKELGGVQSLIDMPHDIGNNSIFFRSPFLIATGLKKCVLIKTAYEKDGLLVPHKGDFLSATVRCTDGTFDSSLEDLDTRAIVFSGGKLDELGALTTAQFASNGSQSWFFVGGAQGLAVLAADDGIECSVNSTPLRFKKVGDYRYIKKLMSDENYLYVLTNSSFERINLRTSNFAGNTSLDCTVLASTALASTVQQDLWTSKYVSFADAVVSGRFALLATSVGLFRVGNGADVRNGSSESLRWCKVAMGGSVGPVVRLLTVTPTGHEKDASCNGQIYALSAYVGSRESQLYRFYLNDNKDEINDTTLQPLPDCIHEGQSVFFVSFDAYHNSFLNDGTCILNVKSLIKNTNKISINKIQVKPFERSRQRIRIGLGKNIKETSTVKIGNIIRSSGSGSLLLPVDYSVYVNE